MSKRQYDKSTPTLLWEFAASRETLPTLESRSNDFQQCSATGNNRTDDYLRISMGNGHLKMDGYIFSPTEVVRLSRKNKTCKCFESSFLFSL